MEIGKTFGSQSPIAQFIKKIPAQIKAILLGIMIYALGSFPALAAISIIPFPFSLIVLFVILFIYLKYFSGRLGIKGALSVRFRTENFREIRLSGEVWRWAILGALIFVVIQQSMFVVTFRIFEYDPDVMVTFQLGDHPSWLLWFFSVASALIAGISEEVGFRGYMQVPMESKYKPWVANTIVSVIFLLFHLNQGWAVPSMFPILFVSSILIGMLVIASNSLLPGIIAHFVVDIFNFSYWWSDLAGKFEYRPIAETGIDPHFLIWLLAFILSVIMFLLVARKTKQGRQSSA